MSKTRLAGKCLALAALVFVCGCCCFEKICWWKRPYCGPACPPPVMCPSEPACLPSAAPLEDYKSQN